MSKNHERAEEILNSFDEQPVHEYMDGEDSYTHRLRFVHELEDLANEEVERGRIPYEVAELAVWSAIWWLEGDNEAKGIK